MKHLVRSSVFNSTFENVDVDDYVYHFYVQTFRYSFVEVTFDDYMETLKLCRKYNTPHHVDVREYLYRCYNLFLELK